MSDKTRLDILLCDKFNLSRENSKELIASGLVKLNGKVVTKPGLKVDENFDLEVLDDSKINKYVSRAGFKLEHALEKFDITLDNKVCIDVGASTGGFTQCMLKNNAKKIYAIDTGKEQLHSLIKAEKNVISLEQTNINDLCKDDFAEPIEFVTVDVSFVSIEKIIFSVNEIMAENASGVFLIKPQFEVGRGKTTKNGVVKDKKLHKKVITNIVNVLVDLSIVPVNIDVSPIEGHAGNIEYLLYVKKTDNVAEVPEIISGFIKKL